jgi:hypothetical protein
VRVAVQTFGEDADDHDEDQVEEELEPVRAAVLGRRLDHVCHSEYLTAATLRPR